MYDVLTGDGSRIPSVTDMRTFLLRNGRIEEIVPCGVAYLCGGVKSCRWRYRDCDREDRDEMDSREQKRFSRNVIERSLITDSFELSGRSL